MNCFDGVMFWLIDLCYMMVYIIIVKWKLCTPLTDSKIVTEMTRDDLFEICDRNDYKRHRRNIQIKYKIIIIFQYKIKWTCIFLCSVSHKFIIKSISITHPLGFHFRKINHFSCTVCEQIMWLTVKRQFSKWGHQSKYKVCHVQI